MIEYLFFITGLLCLIRAVLGPTFADRIMSIDIFGNIIILMMVVYAIAIQSSFYLDVAMVIALLSFTGVLSIARWVN
ncbi:MAG: cation:proton antiporter [DPANN group archaeon]|nr:cation:proton antiporter [DPANN group archaeon]